MSCDEKMLQAYKNKIPFQRAAASRVTGTDTDAFAYSTGGVASSLISLSLRYMHTTVETTDLRDLEAISTIYAKFCIDLAADFAEHGDAYQPFIPDYSS